MAASSTHVAGTVETKTHCPYCAFQCGMRVSPGEPSFELSGDEAFPVNQGRLCIKGWTAAATVDHRERLLTPLLRSERGALEPARWDEALDHVARRLRRAQAEHGRDAVGVFGSGALTHEKAYLLGKFARVALKTAHVDYNGRYCMSSAAAASNRAFGLDRGLPFPLEDLPGAGLIVLCGGNPGETMPPLMQYFEAQRSNGGQLIVVDPRRTKTAESATLHLRLRPGTDSALANGLLHLLVRDHRLDDAFIAQRTEGFEAVKASVAGHWPDRVERITGVAEAQLVRAAELLAEATTAMILTGRGPEQQARGVDNTLAYINLALALGLPGRPFSGYGCLTGQGNGQGGREHGQKADQLPGYRRIDDPVARESVARVWNIAAEELPGAGRSAFELIQSAGEAGGLRALLVMGSNLVVSSPDRAQVERRLRALDFLVVCDFFLSETALLADVVLPSAQWLEEDGTLTNLEGRVIRRRRAKMPPAEVRTDLDILCGLAARLDQRERFSFESSEAVFNELRRATAGGPADYAGITYARLDSSSGVFWPCPDEHHPGTPRLFAETFPTPNGRARFHAVQHQPIAEPPDDAFPLLLTTGRLLAHYQSGTQTHRVEALERLAPSPAAQLHPTTARSYGITGGERVTLRTRRGEARFIAELTHAIREDTVFIPFHWGDDGCANRLTLAALDPVSRMPEFKVCAVQLHKDTGRE